MPFQAKHLFEFGPYRLDPVERILSKNGSPIPLTPKAFDTLNALLTRHGHIFEKDELLKLVWPDSFVEEATLAQNIFTLRKVLGDGEDGTRYIETIPKRGYRFVASVRELAPTEVKPDASRGPSPSALSAEAGLGIPAIPPKSALFRTRRSLLLALASLALVAGSLYFVRRFWRPSLLATPRIMLVVLPVENLTGDSSRDFVTDGLTEELISQLGSLNPEKLGLIARTSSMVYKHSNQTVSQIARDLKVDYLLEASVRGTADHLRVTAQLIRASDQTHVWASDYDRNVRDIVSLEDDVSRAIAREIQVQLTPAAAGRLERGLVIKPDSYQSYLQGRYYWNQRTPDALWKGLGYFQQAVEQDPANARAYAGIADSLNVLLFYGFSPGSGTILKARDAAMKSVEVDDSLPEGHAALAYVDFMWTWQWPQAEKEFRRAIELDPNYLSAHHWYALYLASRGRQAQANSEIQIAQRLDPLSPIIQSAAAYLHYFGRDYDASLRECRLVLQSNPDFPVAHAVLGQTYEAIGKLDLAIAEFNRALELMEKRPPVYKAWLGHAYALAGRESDALKIIADFDELAKKGSIWGRSEYALIYAGLGQRDKAIEALVDAENQNDSYLIWLGVDPHFDNLRSEPRFQELLKKTGITP